MIRSEAVGTPNARKAYTPCTPHCAGRVAAPLSGSPPVWQPLCGSPTATEAGQGDGGVGGDMVAWRLPDLSAPFSMNSSTM